MKNLAIIVGVIDYVDGQLRLPGCQKDVEVMQMILRSSGRFEVQTLESSDGESIKNHLSNLIERYSQEEIDHLLFYFTGHGAYQKDDFYFLFRDYTITRAAQASLSSKELDNMLRSLQPKLAVKVIDACYSGLNYVKSGTTVQEELGEGMREKFTNCHFMFSSEGDQKSYADRNMSYFTSAFAHSIINAKMEDIRYRHITDSITDTFINHDIQTPYFVSQGRFTEIFGKFTDATKQRISAMLPENESNKGELSEAISNVLPSFELVEQFKEAIAVPASSLADKARQAAINYVTQEQASSVIQCMRDRLSKYILSEDLVEIYSPETEFLDSYPILPNERAIAIWLEHNRSGEYFAEPTYRTEIYDAPPSLLGSGIDSLMAEFNLPTKKTRKVLSGVTSSLHGMPFQTFCLTLHPTLPNLVLYRAWLTYLISKTTIQVFHSFVQYKEISWEKYEESELAGWSRNTYSLSEPDESYTLTNLFFAEFNAWVLEQVTKRLATL